MLFTHKKASPLLLHYKITLIISIIQKNLTQILRITTLLFNFFFKCMVYSCTMLRLCFWTGCAARCTRNTRAHCLPRLSACSQTARFACSTRNRCTRTFGNRTRNQIICAQCGEGLFAATWRG